MITMTNGFYDFLSKTRIMRRGKFEKRIRDLREEIYDMNCFGEPSEKAIRSNERFARETFGPESYYEKAHLIEEGVEWLKKSQLPAVLMCLKEMEECAEYFLFNQLVLSKPVRYYPFLPDYPQERSGLVNLDNLEATIYVARDSIEIKKDESI